jgi:alkylation response protein AidB-like acyl-CoA dehydrogenase
VSLDLAFDPAQAAIADALGQFCADRAPADAVKAQAGQFPAELWRMLAEQGVLALAAPDGEGGAVELVAALEPLGRAVFPGPIFSTVLAAQVLPEKQRAQVMSGEALVAVADGPLVPWAPVADLFVELEGDDAHLARPRGPVEPLATLGGEPWGRVALERVRPLGDARRALALHDLALAAYLSAAGRRLVEDAADHARTRKQFGAAIGEFQAVALPLADSHLRLGACETLARAAACCFDGGDERSAEFAAAARVSASSAAREAAFTAHQVFGAIGITLEGPAFHVSRRIQQLAAQPPGLERGRSALLARYGM